MPDYLSQLALRVQQPEFAVQPRPVSRFESQGHSIPMVPEPSAQKEADERGLQSAIFIPAETTADRRTQPADSRVHRKSDTLDSLSEVQSTKKYHNLHPGESTVAPAIVAPASSTEVTDSPVLEVAHPAPRRQQGERIIRSAVAPAQLPARVDRLEQQISKNLPDPSGRQERSEFTDLVARRETEWSRPIVRIENPKGEQASSPMTRARNHSEIGTLSEPTETEPLFGRKAEITTKSGLTPAQGRKNPQSLGDRTAPQLERTHTTDVPTIQVTIGRVEIRATVASTPTRKTPTHRPAMNLDEYLNQRNGSRG